MKIFFTLEGGKAWKRKLAKIVTVFDCNKIVGKNVKKPCRCRILTIELTGNSVDVSGLGILV